MSHSERPLLTFALFAYNQERYVAEAVRGALSQTYSPLEIILSDDCSTDATFSIIQTLAATYTGHNQVYVRQSPRNRGLANHINDVMGIAHGELIIGAAGDDISFSTRTQKIYEAYLLSERKAYSIFSSAHLIDSDGNTFARLAPPSFSALSAEILSIHNIGVSGSTHAWRRDVFDVFGPLNSDVVAEDQVIPFRSAILGEVKYVNEPLVAYRIHDSSLSRFASQSDFRLYGKNLAAIYRARLSDLGLIEKRLPHLRKRLSRLERNTTHLLMEAEVDELLYTARAIDRLGIIGLALLKGASVRRVGRWLTVYYLPWLYRKYYRKAEERTRLAL